MKTWAGRRNLRRENICVGRRDEGAKVCAGRVDFSRGGDLCWEWVVHFAFLFGENFDLKRAIVLEGLNLQIRAGFLGGGGGVLLRGEDGRD